MTTVELTDAIPSAVRAGAASRAQIAGRLGVGAGAEAFEVAFGLARMCHGVDYADGCCPPGRDEHGDDCRVVLR